MYLTLTVAHVVTFKLFTLKNLPLDLLSTCRYCMFLNIYILQSSVAT